MGISTVSRNFTIKDDNLSNKKIILEINNEHNNDVISNTKERETISEKNNLNDSLINSSNKNSVKQNSEYNFNERSSNSKINNNFINSNSVSNYNKSFSNEKSIIYSDQQLL